MRVTVTLMGSVQDFQYIKCEEEFSETYLLVNSCVGKSRRLWFTLQLFLSFVLFSLSGE